MPACLPCLQHVGELFVSMSAVNLLGRVLDTPDAMSSAPDNIGSLYRTVYKCEGGCFCKVAPLCLGGWGGGELRARVECRSAFLAAWLPGCLAAWLLEALRSAAAARSLPSPLPLAPSCICHKWHPLDHIALQTWRLSRGCPSCSCGLASCTSCLTSCGSMFRQAGAGKEVAADCALHPHSMLQLCCLLPACQMPHLHLFTASPPLPLLQRAYYSRLETAVMWLVGLCAVVGVAQLVCVAVWGLAGHHHH